MTGGRCCSHQLMRPLPVALRRKHLHRCCCIASAGQLLCVIAGHQVLRVLLIYERHQLSTVACQLTGPVKEATSTQGLDSACNSCSKHVGWW